jgi:hypothetical protein
VHRIKRRAHLAASDAVLADDPERGAQHARRRNEVELVDELGDNRRAQIGIGLDHLAHKLHDVGGALRRVVAEKLEQQVHDGGGDVGKLDGARVNGVYEHLTVLALLLELLRLRARNLLLQHLHDLVDVLQRDQVEREQQRLATNVDRRTRERAQHVEQQVLHHLRVALLDDVEAVEHNQLDVVVALGAQHIDEGGGGGAHGRRRRRQLEQRGGGLEAHRGRAGAQQAKDDANILAAHRRLLTNELAHELDDNKLQHLGQLLDVIEHAADILDGALGHAVDEHDKRVALARSISFGRQKIENQVGRVGNQVLGVLVDRIDAEHCIATHIRVTMFQIGTL